MGLYIKPTLIKKFVIHLSTRYQHILIYAVVGGLSLGLQNLFYIVGYKYCLFNPSLAMFLAKILGVSLSYFGHFKYTFRHNSHKFSVIVKHILVTILGIVFAVGSVHILTYNLELSPIWGLVPALLSPIINYLLTRFWTFGNAQT